MTKRTGRPFGEREAVARAIAQRFNVDIQKAHHLKLHHSADGIHTRLDLISPLALQVLINSLQWDGRARRVKR